MALTSNVKNNIVPVGSLVLGNLLVFIALVVDKVYTFTVEGKAGPLAVKTSGTFGWGDSNTKGEAYLALSILGFLFGLSANGFLMFKPESKFYDIPNWIFLCFIATVFILSSWANSCDSGKGNFGKSSVGNTSVSSDASYSIGASIITEIIASLLYFGGGVFGVISSRKSV